MKRLLFALIFFSDIAFGQSVYQKDFNEFWTIINNNYAYFHQQQIDWKKVKEIYEPEAVRVTNNEDFIKFLETILKELYNGHSSLTINLQSSNRLIPSGLDIYVERINGKYVISDLRKDMGAEKCGLKVGMEIVKFNDNEIAGQLEQFLPEFTKKHNSEMVQFSISMLFAGTHNKHRKITTLEKGNYKEYYPDSVKIEKREDLIEFKALGNKVGYLKITIRK